MSIVSEPVSPQDRLARALSNLEATFGTYPGEFSLTQRPAIETQVSVLADAMRDVLMAVGASLGECRVDTPYAVIQLVRHHDGSREWCCSHDPAHCDPA